MGANNHPTVVPNETAADSRERVSFSYSDHNGHDTYMLKLRLSAIRAGVIDPKLE